MSGIIIQSNFDLNQTVPLDSRMVATNSESRNSILYKYEGLKVYQVDERKTFLWNGSTWSIDSSGIYGASGSLLNNTTISFGTVSSTIGSKSYVLTEQASANNNRVMVNDYFQRHSSEVIGSEWLGIEYRKQFRYFNGTSYIDSSYISINPSDPNSLRGAMSFNTGDGSSYAVAERLRITTDGKFGFGTNDPKEFIQIGSTLPITIRRDGNTTTLAHNWYYNGADYVYDSSFGSSRIISYNGEISIFHRAANQSASSFYQSIYISSNVNKLGYVGVGNGFSQVQLPQYPLDVNGVIRSSATVSSVNSESSNTVKSPSYLISGLTDSKIYQSNSNLILRVLGATSLSVNNDYVYLHKDTFINSSLNVLDDVIVNTGDLIVTTGSITNYEESSVLSPIGDVIVSTNGSFGATTDSISNFTYSITAYRVGALVHMNVYFKRLSGVDYSGSALHGIMVKVSGERFRPNTTSFGSGYAGFSARTFSSPIVLEAFVSDSTGGGASSFIEPSSQFWIRLRTFFNFVGGSQGTDLTTGTITDLTFRGTITYKVGTATVLPVIPTLPVFL